MLSAAALSQKVLTLVQGKQIIQHKSGKDHGVCRDCSNLGYTCSIVPNRVVAAMVTKLELECFAAKGLAQELVPHTNAKNGLLSEQLLHALDSIKALIKS